MIERVTITKEGNLEVDLRNVLQAISIDSKQDLINYLCCDEEIIQKVTDQIIDGFFDDGHGWWSGSSASKSLNPSTSLDKAARRISLAANEIAKKEIERLSEALSRSQKRVLELEEKRFKRTINY